MKIAVTSTGPDQNSPLDHRFGRCPYFILADVGDTGTHFESVSNVNASLGGGAGTASAQLMIDKGVQVVLTGNCGPKSKQALAAAGIEIVAGCTGTVDEVIDQFKAGRLGPS